MEYVMNFPADKAELSKLRAGDKLTVSGTIYTARDAAHKRLTELIASGEELPLDIRGAAIYYAGPTPEKPGQVIGSCGPTTSGRMDAYAPGLLDRGLAVMIGKGDRNAAVIDAIVRNGAVYLAAMGGAGALMLSRRASCAMKILAARRYASSRSRICRSPSSLILRGTTCIKAAPKRISEVWRTEYGRYGKIPRAAL